MYKVASDKAAAAAHRGRLVDWVGGEQVLTNEQRRDSLVTKVKSLSKALRGVKDKDERKRIGQEIYDLNTKINELRPKAKCPDANRHFIEAAREVLPRATFKQVLRMATIRAQNTCVDEQVMEELERFHGS